MLNSGLYLTIYDGTFANIVEKNNKWPALKWDEVISLKLAYNNYDENSLKEIFNGEVLDKEKLAKDYENAVKQLAGAFQIETQNCPVSLDKLIDSNKQKRIYYKVNRYFNEAKRTNGNTKINYINKFYKTVYKAINSSDSQTITYALEPMVKAANKLFKNEKINKKIYRKIRKYYKSKNIIDIRNNKYQKIENILATGKTNKNIPLYTQFKHAKIRELKENNWYNISERSVKKPQKAKVKVEYNYDNALTSTNYESKETPIEEEATIKEKNKEKKIVVVKKKTDINNKKEKTLFKDRGSNVDNYRTATTEHTEFNTNDEENKEEVYENTDNEISNEDIADQIVEEMATETSSTHEESYQYTYKK